MAAADASASMSSNDIRLRDDQVRLQRDQDKMYSRFDAIEGKITALDGRLIRVEERLVSIDKRIDQLNTSTLDIVGKLGVISEFKNKLENAEKEVAEISEWRKNIWRNLLLTIVGISTVVAGLIHMFGK